MKNKGLPMWQRLATREWWFDTQIRDWQDVVLLILVVLFICAFIITPFAAIVHFAPDTTDIYMRTYADCMAHDDMNKYLCHQIALEKVGD